MGKLPWRIRRDRLAFLAGIALAALPFYAQRGPGPAIPAASSANGPGDYVDARTCARCHQQIYADYAKTGMGRSFYRPAAANPAENLKNADDFYHAVSDTHFSVQVRNGEYFQRRWQLGLSGQEINVEEAKIDYVMGSGNHARSYLHRTARGTLIELPLGWYAEDRAPSPASPSANHWGMSPGSDSAHPLTRRFISYKCMFCHNGIPQIPAGNEEPDSDPVYTGALPEGIDCQRCHGPGGRHIKTVQTRGSTRADVEASIVNPARLAPKARMEICMQCHLETSSGRIPAAVVRFNRAPFSFVPGEPLDSFMLTFDQAPGTGHDDKFEAVNSVYRLRKSQCFLQSAGKMTCETCHNPHRAPRGEEATAQYVAVCRGCHGGGKAAGRSLEALVTAGRHPAGGNCLECHMPKRRAEDTPGMIMTDHLIQRRKPAGDLLAEFREPGPRDYHGEVVPYYPAPLPATPENALYVAVAQVGNGNNLEAGLPRLAREIAQQKPREPEFYKVLGDAWQRAGKPQEAVGAYEQAVRLKPRSLTALRALAEGLTAAGQTNRAEEALKKSLAIAPDDAITWYRYGLLDLGAGRSASAVDKMRKAIQSDPALPDQARGLAEILHKTGESGPAQVALAEALRTDPYDDAAWDLQGRLSAEKGELQEARFAFERAIRLAPADASHLFDYALALARMDRLDEALERGLAAVRITPGVAEIHELLGGLYEAKRLGNEAVREYRRTLELSPQLSRVHLRLGNLLVAQGDAAGAREHLGEAARSSDAGVAQRATQALTALEGQPQR